MSSTAMGQKYKVTTYVGAQEREWIWDPSSPLVLDAKAEWALEHTDSGIHVRYLGGGFKGIQQNARIPVTGDHLDRNEILAIDHPQSPNVRLQIKRMKPVTPAYLSTTHSYNQKQGVIQLIAYSGIGRALLGSQTIHSAYVAYVRNRPVYTLYHKEDGYHIKPLMDGVRLKFKGQRSILGEEGKSWVVPESDIFKTTVIRGNRWWRFNYIKTETLLKDILDVVSLDEQQTRGMLRILGGLLILFVIAIVITWKMPRQDKVIEELKEEPVVRFVAPKMPEVKPKEVEEPKKEEIKAPPKPIPEKKPAPKPEPAKKVAPPAPKVPQKAPPKPQKAEAAKSKAPTPPQPSLADQSVQSLKEALGGALSLAEQSTLPTETARVKTSSIFSKSGVAIGSTAIKPGYSSKTGMISTIGGGGSDISYSQGAKSLIGSQKASFVSMETGGMKVEEGLTKEEVGAVIHQHMDEVRYCHESAMLYTPSIEGKIMVQFTISSAGVLEKATIQSSSIDGDKVLGKCITKKMGAWKFPHPKGGIKVTVSYPFVFKTLERGG